MSRIADFVDLVPEQGTIGALHALADFLEHPLVRRLDWPADVAEQWLFDHANNSHFQRDYVDVDLNEVAWRVELVTTDDFLDMPTGPSDADCIDEFSRDPNHWVAVRKHHEGVAEMWEAHGTWKRWPLLLERSLVESGVTGLQVVEGRTRVGILKGRDAQGSFVASRHLAWVGRAREVAMSPSRDKREQVHGVPGSSSQSWVR